MKIFLFSILILSVLFAGTVLLALAFGGPGDLPPLSSVTRPFDYVDYSDLPAVRRFTARDGAELAFRAYDAAGDRAKGGVVLVHGSSADSKSMHVLAEGFAAAGHAVYALDIRGHGESGIKGHIAYIGQLEDDLEDFMGAVTPAPPTTLVGFSSGGGFTLRFAGSARQKLFANYLLLSPFISQDAPTYRSGGGGWVSVGIPRIIAISLLNAVGVRAFNDLAVTRFALDEESRKSLTARYSYTLAQNFRPKRDYQANIRAVGQPLQLIAGKDDEVFHTDRFAAVFEAEGKKVRCTLLPGVDHIGLILEPAAIQAATEAVKGMNEFRGGI